MSKQFEVTRKSLTSFVQQLDETKIDTIPEGFNNNIRWHLGHVLTLGERFMFGYPEHSVSIPKAYYEFFKPGSSPRNWNSEEIPSLAELLKLLDDQTDRLKKLTSAFFDENTSIALKHVTLDTNRDVYELMFYHEAVHLGEMKAMYRLLTK